MKQVKICGMKRPVDIEYVNKYKPDYCGFIINFPKSHRSLNPDEVRLLSKNLCEDVIPVGVFVNEDIDLVAALLNEKVIKVAQLHGNEDNDYINKLKTMTDGIIWQALVVKSDDDVKKADNSAADLVLLDAGRGEGKTFDWQLLKEVKRPYGLAGGLNIDNVNEALKTDAILLDVSGGVEKGGFKDENLLQLFIGSIRS